MSFDRDPTTSESYIALRNALVEVAGDHSAVQSLLSALSDGGRAWVEAAHFELRRALIQGRLKEAETVGNLIGAILEVQDQGAGDELAGSRIHREAMRWLSDGIGAILAQDNLTGICNLEQLTEAVYSDESLRWVAWHWLAIAAADEGDLELAGRAADAAMKLSERFDVRARAASLYRCSEVEFRRGDTEHALERLATAMATFEGIGDRRGTAMAALARARMLVRLGRDDEGQATARQAHEADLDWDEPAVFLSQLALQRGDVAAARQLLEAYVEFEGRSPEVDRQRRLIGSVERQELPLELVREYVQLRARPADSEVVARLDELWEKNPSFLALRELLAWSLVKVGRELEAAVHFKEMANLKLDSEVQSSVLLGLGCLANRQFKHRQPPARVRATASAFSQPAPAPGPRTSGLYEELRLGIDEAQALVQAFGQQKGAAVEEIDAGLPEVAPAPPVVAPVEGKAKVEQGRPLKSVFTGDLQLFAVPDLIDFLNNSRRTGTLVITSEHGIGAVYLHQGSIVGAASPNSTNIGDLLVNEGVITSEQLHAAVENQRCNSPERLLGAIMTEMGMVERSVLEKVLEQQVRGALLEMVSWAQGRFAFEPDKRQEEMPGEIEIQLDTRGLLLDVMREFDEKNRVE